MAIEIKIDIHIDRSPEQVWKILTDIPNYPRWNNHIIQMTKIDEDHYIEIAKNGESGVSIALEITYRKPFTEFRGVTKLRRMVWGFKTETKFHLTPEGNGTRLTRESRLTGLLVFFRKTRLEKFMTHAIKKGMQSLKEAVESNIA